MKLSQKNIDNILYQFPKDIKPCYDNFNYNKVYNNNNIYIIIPQGKKCFLWFTILENQNVCVVLEISQNNNISQFDDIYILVISFDFTLSFNTIFYGTINIVSVNNIKNKYISLNNIFYYKGKNVYRFPYQKKLEIFREYFEYNIKCISQPYIALCIMNENNNIIKDISKHLPYKIKGIKQIPLQEIKPEIKHVIHSIPNKTEYKEYKERNISSFIFRVKPDIKMDIYRLYTLDNCIETFHSLAYIHNCETSILMNKIFRNIKENENIDLIEESDDEDFENTNQEKYVKLNHSEKMICNYNYKFKKFIPISIAKHNDAIVSSIKLKKYNL